MSQTLTPNPLSQANDQASVAQLGKLSVEETDALRTFWLVLAPRIKAVVEKVNEQLADLYPADSPGSPAAGKSVAACLDEAHWCALFVRLESTNNETLACLVRDGVSRDVVLASYRLILLEMTDVVFDGLQVSKLEAIRQSRLTLKAVEKLLGLDLDYVMSFFGKRYVNEDQYKEQILGGTELVARLTETINDSMLCLANLERQSDALQGGRAMTLAAVESLNAALEKIQLTTDEIMKEVRASSRQEMGGTALPESLIHLSGAISDIRKGISSISARSDPSVGITTEVLRWVSRSADCANKMVARTLKPLNAQENFLLGIEHIKIEHLMFCKSMMDIVTGLKPLPDSDPPNQNTCNFSIWYNACKNRDSKTNPQWLAINDPHEKVHVFTREVLGALRAGDKKRALKALFGLHAESKRTIMALEDYAKSYREEQGLLAAQ